MAPDSQYKYSHKSVEDMNIFSNFIKGQYHSNI